MHNDVAGKPPVHICQLSFNITFLFDFSVPLHCCVQYKQLVVNGEETEKTATAGQGQRRADGPGVPLSARAKMGYSREAGQEERSQAGIVWELGAEVGQTTCSTTTA